MRHLLIFLTILGLFAFPSAPQAQDNKKQDDASFYTVTDVPADVTADNAVHARDQALTQAQRLAFNQLIDRLGAPTSVVKKLSDDDIASLVKSFEVQNERRSAVRYIGTFTIQFKPNAVRNYLGSKNATYSETHSSDPIVILPVLMVGDKAVLWEDKTKWRAAWESSVASTGIVPIIVPAGGLDDIAAISTAETVKGKGLKAIIDKYQAHGALVATLSGDMDKLGAPFKVDIAHYDADGDAGATSQITIPAATSKALIDSAITQAVQQTRKQLEKDWRKEEQEPAVQVYDEAIPAANARPTQPTPQEPATHLPVTVMINSLPEWAQIERKLNSIPQVVRVEVIALQRGSTSIELEFHGSIDALQFGLNQQNLVLQQDRVNKVWMLRPMQIGGGY